jgi:Mrp family chromosome partitioning ATPase
MSRKKIKKSRIKKSKPEDFVLLRKQIRKMINKIDKTQEELDQLVVDTPSINVDEEFCDIT